MVLRVVIGIHHQLPVRLQHFIRVARTIGYVSSQYCVVRSYADYILNLIVVFDLFSMLFDQLVGDNHVKQRLRIGTVSSTFRKRVVYHLLGQ